MVDASGSPVLTSSNGQSATPATLLQRFLILQQTRAALSNELTSAFKESDISDAALNKVVEISSVGLLEVREEAREIIVKLTTDGSSQAEISAEISAMTNIEDLERKRITDLTRAHQLRRILTLLAATTSSSDDEQHAVKTRKHEIAEQMTQADQAVRALTQEIAEQIDTIRETVADMS